MFKRAFSQVVKNHGLHICVNCVHFKQSSLTYDKNRKCRMFIDVDEITDEMIGFSLAKKCIEDDKICGKEGKHFTPIMAAFKLYPNVEDSLYKYKYPLFEDYVRKRLKYQDYIKEHKKEKN